MVAFLTAPRLLRHYRSERWFVRLTPPCRTRARLYCFPWSGAGPSAYRYLLDVLPPEIELVGVQLPGRSARRTEPASSSLTSLAEAITWAFLAEPDGRFAFFGHSYGALLAHAVAQRLAPFGITPELVVVSGSRSPMTPVHTPLHRLNDSELLDMSDRLGGMSPGRRQDPDFLRWFLPLMRADLAAVESYVAPPGPALACPLIAWAGEDDWYAPPGEVERWAEIPSITYRFRTFPGGHFFLRGNACTDALLVDLAWAYNGSARDYHSSRVRRMTVR